MGSHPGCTGITPEPGLFAYLYSWKKCLKMREMPLVNIRAYRQPRRDAFTGCNSLCVLCVPPQSPQGAWEVGLLTCITWGPKGKVTCLGTQSKTGRLLPVTPDGAQPDRHNFLLLKCSARV